MAAEQDNAAVVRRFWDLVWNNGELPAIEDLVDDDFTNFGIRRPGGHAALRHIVTAWRTAFPDLHIQVQEEIACGDTVVHRVMARGTHRGEFPPGIGPGRVLDAMAPTGRSFEADQIHIHQVRGGRITGHAGTRNDLLMLSQLGLLPGIEPVSEASWRTQLTPDARPPALARSCGTAVAPNLLWRSGSSPGWPRGDSDRLSGYGGDEGPCLTALNAEPSLSSRQRHFARLARIASKTSWVRPRPARAFHGR